MSFEFKLPDIGEGLVEGEIVKWLVREGDAIAEDQPLVEVMTDKATVEISSPRTGTIEKLIAKEGETVAVEAPIVLIATGNGAAAPRKAAKRDGAPASAAKPQPVRAAEVAESPATPPAPGGKALATPAVRKYAREKGVDLAAVAGTGRNGRVERADVDQYVLALTTAQKLAEAAPAASISPRPAPVPSGATTEIPLRGLRKRIAEAMATSKRHAAHFTYVEEIDMTQVVGLRRGAAAAMEARGAKLSYIPFVIKAVTPAIRQFPIVNSTLDEERDVIIQKGDINIGISVATDEGLIAPVIKGADRRTLADLALEIARLSGDFRARRGRVEDLQGSTFTITSIGNIGGVLATPIINYPEVAILGINEIKERPVVVDGQIVIRHMMYLGISCDHRVVDGAVAALFVREIKRNLENPGFFILDS